MSDLGIAEIGLLERAETGLRSGGLEVVTFAEVLPDPLVSNIMAAIEQAQDFGADGVVGFGGGSSMDVAKLVAFLSHSSQSLSDIYGVGFARGKRLCRSSPNRLCCRPACWSTIFEKSTTRMPCRSIGMHGDCSFAILSSSHRREYCKPVKGG